MQSLIFQHWYLIKIRIITAPEAMIYISIFELKNNLLKNVLHILL